MTPVEQLVQLLFRLISFADIVVSAMGAASLWGLRRKIALVRYTGMLLAAIAVDQIFWQIAQIYHPSINGTVSWWFVIWIVSGRIIRVSAIMSMVLYIIGVKKGDR